MIQETAVVTKQDSLGLWVEARREGQCHSCSAKNGCGHRLLNSVHSARINQLRVTSEDAAVLEKVKVGDCVTIGIEENQILKLSLLFYVVPLLSLLAFVVILNMLGFSELYLILVAGFGLFAGLKTVKWMARRYMNITGVNLVSTEDSDSRESNNSQAIEIRNIGISGSKL